MIYHLPEPDEAIDQGDILDDCPIVALVDGDNGEFQTKRWNSRVIVVTQTCDLAQQRVSRVVVAEIQDAQEVVSRGQLKPSDIRGSLRSGRVFGWYFLPRSEELELPEMIIDLRQLHTVPLTMLTALCRNDQRRGRVQPLYREHLAKHFADSYSRIGLPQPYETM